MEALARVLAVAPLAGWMCPDRVGRNRTWQPFYLLGFGGGEEFAVGGGGFGQAASCAMVLCSLLMVPVVSAVRKL